MVIEVSSVGMYNVVAASEWSNLSKSILFFLQNQTEQHYKELDQEVIL